jgi:RNA polymerase sigma factor (sigma-70 family)
VAPLSHNPTVTPRALLAPARLAGQTVLRTQSDERLVDLVRAGNAAAFEAVVARYRRPLLRHASRILPAERAEDAVQQAFLRAYDAMRARDSELKLRPWLYRIAHNTALNALRDRDLRHEQLSESLDGVERPDQVVERRLGLTRTMAGVRALPRRQRDAIVLRELEGRSYEEIAAELGVTDGAVRQLLNRARTALRAGASAVTPAGLIARIPWAAPSESVAPRVAELCGGAGAGAAVAKACATVLVTGAVVGGVTALPGERLGHDGREAGGASAVPVARGSAGLASGAPLDRVSPRGPGAGEAGDDPSPRGPGNGSDDRSGSGGGEQERVDDRSGPSSGEGSGSDRSGSGESELEDAESLSSGPGPSGSTSGESDSSGSGESGSGTYSSAVVDDSSGSSGSIDSSGSGSGSESSGSGELADD